MSDKSLLLVEDDETLGLALEIALTEEGYEVTRVQTLAAALAATSRTIPQLLVLDLGLPDGDGIRVCERLRQKRARTAILILTARGTLEARVQGLEAGADDYLTKPFELPELCARLRALERRMNALKNPQLGRASLGALEVDFDDRSATVNGEVVALTDLEFRLLHYLLAHRGEIVTREQLLTEVWGRAPTERTRTVDVYMSRLRRHIDPEERSTELLTNIRGVGYRLQ